MTEQNDLNTYNELNIYIVVIDDSHRFDLLMLIINIFFAASLTTRSIWAGISGNLWPCWQISSA